MLPRLRDARSGRLEELRPRLPPRLALLREESRETSLSALRLRVVGSCLFEGLRHLGLEPEEGGESPELYCGATELPRGEAVWLKVAPAGGELPPQAGTLSEGELRLLCLGVPYGEGLDLSASAIGRAREAAGFLRAQARRLEAARGLAPSPSGLAGYRKRFRDALADDLNLPASLRSLLDALRPGALSPGSQFGALREADAVLGLGLLRP